MKGWQVGMCIAPLIVVCVIGYIIGYDIGSRQVTATKESREHRQIELDLADVKARLATLERIGVEVEVSDRSGTWFVPNGKVQ